MKLRGKTHYTYSQIFRGGKLILQKINHSCLLVIVIEEKRGYCLSGTFFARESTHNFPDTQASLDARHRKEKTQNPQKQKLHTHTHIHTHKHTKTHSLNIEN